MRIELTHHNYPAAKFHDLKTMYPTGYYQHGPADTGVVWFVLVIEGVEITWFKDRSGSE
mgnify:CR=1 FL=1